MFFAQYVFSDPLKIRDFFVSMPDTVLPILHKNDRLDILDLYDNIQSAAGKDNYSGISISDRWLRLLYSPGSHVKMAMFTHKTDTVLSLIHTFFTSVPLSVVSFYSTDWEPILNESVCTMPSPKDFVKKEYTNKDSIRLLECHIPFDTYIIDVDTLEQSLLFKYTGNSFFSVEDSARFLDWFSERTVKLRWNGKRFK